MIRQGLIGAIAIAALFTAASGAQAFDEAKYPEWKGQWRRAEGGPPRYDPSRPLTDQQAPLTEEYKAVHAASIADQKSGGQGNDPTYTCIAPGMPRIANVYDPMEIVITPEVTHILVQHVHDSRRIFTDGRAWPADVEPTFAGYSIGQWRDTDGDGRYDTLEIETRNMRGPRAFDGTGLPLHRDNKTVVKERITTDKSNPNVIVNEITTIDNALTRPWSVVKTYRRLPKVIWTENNCTEGNDNIAIGDEVYLLSGDGRLMPIRKGQKPPDLSYFGEKSK
jgi:hypothetical protein